MDHKGPLADTMYTSYLVYTVNNKKYSNPEYWGKIPRIFKLFHNYSKIENAQNINYSQHIENIYKFLDQIIVWIFSEYLKYSWALIDFLGAYLDYNLIQKI